MMTQEESRAFGTEVRAMLKDPNVSIENILAFTETKVNDIEAPDVLAWAKLLVERDADDDKSYRSRLQDYNQMAAKMPNFVSALQRLHRWKHDNEKASRPEPKPAAPEGTASIATLKNLIEHGRDAEANAHIRALKEVYAGDNQAPGARRADFVWLLSITEPESPRWNELRKLFHDA